MVSYIPLDNYSIISPHSNCDKVYNLSKSYRIEIPPNSDYEYIHGFYFYTNIKQPICVQLDQTLPNFLLIKNIINSNNINIEPIIITNLSSNPFIIEPLQIIFNISDSNNNFYI